MLIAWQGQGIVIGRKPDNHDIAFICAMHEVSAQFRKERTKAEDDDQN